MMEAVLDRKLGQWRYLKLRKLFRIYMRENIVAYCFYCCLSDPKVEAAFVVVRTPVEIRCQEVRSQQEIPLLAYRGSIREGNRNKRG